MEKMIKTETEIMQSKMGSLNLQIQTLTGEKLALERELDGGVLVPDRAAALVGGRRGVLRSPDDFSKGGDSSSKKPRTAALDGGMPSRNGGVDNERKAIGPNGVSYRRSRGGYHHGGQ